jgi:hypothetical protein
MTIQLQLSGDEARLLLSHLSQHLHHLDAELVRTDKHDLQHALAREIEALQEVVERLSSEQSAAS